jgi:hypothetical protein
MSASSYQMRIAALTRETPSILSRTDAGGCAETAHESSFAESCRGGHLLWRAATPIRYSVQMAACPECRLASISVEENARALFKEIECPSCGHRLRVKWADTLRVVGGILLLALGLLLFQYRREVSSGAWAGVFLCLAALSMGLQPLLRRLPLTKA